MARLYAAVIAVGCLALVWAARTPSFNANLSSPALLRSLTSEYLAVDAIYGGVTSPYTIDAVLHRQAPSTPPMGFDVRSQPIPITRAADGVRAAQQAEAAVAALGATAELVPVRRELLQSYRDVERAWRDERVVEQAMPNMAATSRTGMLSVLPSVQLAGDSSVAAMQQARSLHDQAIAVVHALSETSPSTSSTSRGGVPDRYQTYDDSHNR